MGHSSIASLNKTGKSNYWNAMWDDKHLYTKSLHETMFLQEFIPSFFEHFSYRFLTVSLLNRDFSLKNTEKYRVFLKKKNDYKELYSKVDKFYDRYFFSKIWVLKYHKWVVIYFFVYTSFLADENEKYKKNFIESEYIQNIVFDYINTVIFFKNNLSNNSNNYKNRFEF